MNYNILFSLTSLFYILMLTIVFFFKKRLNSLENKIYKYMVIFALSGVILELSQVVTGLIMNTGFGWINSLVSRFYLVNVLIWISLLSIYTIVISFEKKYYKKLCYIIIDICAICSCCLLFLPINYYFEPGKTVYSYTYGTSVDLLKLISIIFLIFSIFCMIINIKHLRSKKYFPIIIYTILFLVSGIIQIVNPILVLNQSVQIFTTFLMYFTIENPDLKIIHQLDAAKDQADKANRAKTDFLSSMSHEIRTPLNAIVGFSDYIMTSESLEEAKENAQDIVNASNTLLEIVNGILDISKIEAGKLEIVNSKYNARQTFESLAKLITPKMKEKGLDFTYYIAPDLPDTLFGDHANLKKIVTNLLSNAYKYTETGSVRYEVNCINSNNITKLIITVEDTGRGIKPDKIDSLFTKFQRLDEDKNTTIEGTGLGLAITKQLIELMGGKILVHTVYGEGSKFTVVLNQHIEKTEIVEEKVEIKTTLDLKNKKILLVDDNSLNIKVANKILERFNANNITSLDNGFDCIDLIQSGAVFDIILMDDMMPKMSGVETFKKLREIEGFNQPVVILTANAITGMKEKYLKEGFEDYLAKPIEKDELIRVCNTIFQKYQSNQPEPPEEEEIVETPIIEKIEPVVDVQTIEEIKPIEMVEEIEELEVIGEEEPITNKIDYLKQNGVDLNKSIELLGDIEMYDMTINDFLSEVEEKWNNIVTYKNNSDMENYAIEVHSLKSDAKYLGFMSLADIAYQHELKSKENDINFILEHFTELEIEYNKALNIAKTYIKM